MTSHPIKIRRRHRRAALALAACAAVTPAFARAMPVSWNTAVGSGNWNVPANWTPATVPGTSTNETHIAFLNQGDAVDRTVTYAQPAGTNILLFAFNISATGAGSMTFAQPQDTLRISAEYTVARDANSRGAVNQTGGSTHVSSSLVLGATNGTHGTYTMSGGAQLNTGIDLRVGAFGTGVFAQSGGTNTVTGLLEVGNTNAVTASTFTLSGGTLSAATARVNAGATFTLSGGRFNNGTNALVIENAGNFTYAGGTLQQARLINTGSATLSLAPNTSFEAFRGLLHASSVPLVIPAGNTLRAFVTGLEVYGQMSSSGAVFPSQLNIGGASGSAVAGVYTQNGGIVAGSGSASGLNVNKGSYTLNAGELDFAALGVNAAFTQAGGTAVTAAIFLTGTNSAFLQTGGVLRVQPYPNGVGFDSIFFFGSATLGATTHWGASARANINGGTHTFAGTQTWHPTSQLIVNGGSLNLATDATGANVTLTGGNLSFGASQHLNAFSATNAGTATVTPPAPGGTRVLVTRAFAMSGSAKLNLRNNAIVVDYTGATNAASALAPVRAALTSGYSPTAAAHWNGPGIGSTDAAADPTAAIGYALASAALNLSGTQTATFLGETVDATSVLVRFTHSGDATLDGAVNFQDLVRLAQHYGQTITDPAQSAWFNGDFTYDGTVDFQDLVKLAQNYGAVAPNAPIPGATAPFEHDVARAFASVPEPTALPCLALALAPLVRFRRTRTLI